MRTVFCSKLCLENYAWESIDKKQMYWCPIHEEWHAEAERASCEEAKRLMGV